MVDLPDFPERFVDIGHRGDEGSSLPDRAMYSFPIEWISPAIVLVSRASGAFQNFEEVDGLVVILFPIEDL